MREDRVGIKNQRAAWAKGKSEKKMEQQPMEEEKGGERRG